MIGSAGDFGANCDSKGGSLGSGEDCGHTVRSDDSEAGGGMEDWRPLHTSQMGAGDDEGGGQSGAMGLPKLFGSALKVRKGGRLASEGADSFSSEMKRFEHIKLIIQAAHTPQGYRECLLDQSLDNVITIPVAYMKVRLLTNTGTSCSQILHRASSVVWCSLSIINHCLDVLIYF